jgi:hypothetical protein
VVDLGKVTVTKAVADSGSRSKNWCRLRKMRTPATRKTINGESESDAQRRNSCLFNHRYH